MASFSKNKIILLVHTLRYLRPKQVYYRFYYFVVNRFFKREYKDNPPTNFNTIQWEDGIRYANSHSLETNFTFLNITHDFRNTIDWNFAEYGKLWTYNLNYFDFLNQEEIDKEVGLSLIRNYIASDDKLKDGKEPYPISLRGINWVKFLSKHSIADKEINRKLFQHYQNLRSNLEYHLLGNHLLENAFSLVFGAYYFQDNQLYKKARKLLKAELQEQTLEDGAHFELSPMYHQILFHRLLDVIQLIRLNSSWQQDELLNFLIEKASLMRSWLENITYKNGQIPMVNDSAYGIAPKTPQLIDYAEELQVSSSKNTLSDSGYRKVEGNNYELLMDVGTIQSGYQPGHTHSDIFHFELVLNNKPILVDRGTSTYEKNNTRQLERSTFSHNTVMIGDSDQSEVWGGFRVARRAKVFDLQSFENKISAKHNGYKRKGIVHNRSFEWFDKEIYIHDFLSKKSNNKAKAIFHFHSNIKKPVISSNQITLDDMEIKISFHGSTRIQLLEYNLCEGFNKSEKAYKLVVNFNKELKTIIYL